jgi:acyl-CoA reductase-like NAD-dependent aldehyde dehydrogenase
MPRLDVTKTHKLYINGGFPRSESGRSIPVRDAEWNVVAHLCHASRKDLRDAVGAARQAAGPWAARTAYNRGQILYRMAEMLQGKAEEMASALRLPGDVALRDARREVDASIDRLVCWAGWADKLAHVLGAPNPVAGPFVNVTIPEPTGVVAIVAPDDPPLLGLVSLLAPALAAGNAVVALGSPTTPIPTCVLGEVCATSDVPAGVVNLLTGERSELAPWIASHRAIDAVHAADLDPDTARTLRLGAAENVKRVRVRRVGDWFSDELDTPWVAEGLMEMKTIWRPAGA